MKSLIRISLCFALVLAGCNISDDGLVTGSNNRANNANNTNNVNNINNVNNTDLIDVDGDWNFTLTINDTDCPDDADPFEFCAQLVQDDDEVSLFVDGDETLGTAYEDRVEFEVMGGVVIIEEGEDGNLTGTFDFEGECDESGTIEATPTAMCPDVESMAIDAVFPDVDATEVPRDTIVYVDFSSPVDESRLIRTGGENDTLILRNDAGNRVPGTVRTDGDRAIEFEPAAPLLANTTYTVTLNGPVYGTEDGQEYTMDQYQWSFATIGPIFLVSTAPAYDTELLRVDDTLVLTFSSELDTDTVAPDKVTVNAEGRYGNLASGSSIPISVTANQNQISIQAQQTWQEFGTVYSVGVTGVMGADGRPVRDTNIQIQSVIVDETYRYNLAPEGTDRWMGVDFNGQDLRTFGSSGNQQTQWGLAPNGPAGYYVMAPGTRDWLLGNQDERFLEAADSRVGDDPYMAPLAAPGTAATGQQFRFIPIPGATSPMLPQQVGDSPGLFYIEALNQALRLTYAGNDIESRPDDGSNEQWWRLRRNAPRN